MASFDPFLQFEGTTLRTGSQQPTATATTARRSEEVAQRVDWVADFESAFSNSSVEEIRRRPEDPAMRRAKEAYRVLGTELSSSAHVNSRLVTPLAPAPKVQVVQSNPVVPVESVRRPVSGSFFGDIPSGSSAPKVQVTSSVPVAHIANVALQVIHKVPVVPPAPVPIIPVVPVSSERRPVSGSFFGDISSGAPAPKVQVTSSVPVTHVANVASQVIHKVPVVPPAPVPIVPAASSEVSRVLSKEPVVVSSIGVATISATYEKSKCPKNDDVTISINACRSRETLVAELEDYANKFRGHIPTSNIALTIQFTGESKTLWDVPVEQLNKLNPQKLILQGVPFDLEALNRYLNSVGLRDVR